MRRRITITAARRWVTVTLDDGQRNTVPVPTPGQKEQWTRDGLAPCCGPCHCLIHPDHTCRQGWPSRIQGADTNRVECLF